MPNMRGQNLNLAFGTEVIYDDAEFYIGDNDKTGIVGVNGAGKTVLFFCGEAREEARCEAEKRGIRDICYITKGSRRIENV